MRSAFDEYRARWTEAYNRKDLGALAELYTENGVFYSGDGRVARGREAIRRHFEQDFAEYEKLIPGVRPRFESEVEDEEVLGDTGYEFGSYRITTPQGRVLVEGSYSGIGRRVGDAWKIARHMSTARQAVPGPQRKLTAV